MQFLGLQEVLEIHRDQVTRYGGTAGIRDLDLLTRRREPSDGRSGEQTVSPDLLAPDHTLEQTGRPAVVEQLKSRDGRQCVTE